MNRFLLILLLLGGACQNQEKAPTATAPTKDTVITKVVDEDELILKLSSHFIAAPKDQAEVDQNTILNYAIDNGLDLEKTNSGLFYRIDQPGEGKFVSWGNKIEAHYKGYFLDGKVFDSSYKKGKPLEFYVGNMIDAWNEGLQLLKPGGKMLLITPSTMGYGEKGITTPKGDELIPANSILVFEIEVIQIVD